MPTFSTPPLIARGRLSAGSVLVAVLLVGGCGAPPWQQSRPGGPTAIDSSAPTGTGTSAPSVASPSASPTPVAPPNDLAKGSLKRQLTAGGIDLEATYYSTLPLQRWTPAASKPLTVAVSGRFPDGSRQDIYLSDVEVRVDVTGSEGPLPGPEPLRDQATVSPGYLIRSPSTYGQVFTVPALPAQARGVTLNVTYQLLAPTAPQAKTYLKQSANDTLSIPLAP